MVVPNSLEEKARPGSAMAGSRTGWERGGGGGVTLPWILEEHSPGIAGEDQRALKGKVVKKRPQTCLL